MDTCPILCWKLENLRHFLPLGCSVSKTMCINLQNNVIVIEALIFIHHVTLSDDKKENFLYDEKYPRIPLDEKCDPLAIENCECIAGVSYL